MQKLDSARGKVGLLLQGMDWISGYRISGLGDKLDTKFDIQPDTGYQAEYPALMFYIQMFSTSHARNFYKKTIN